MEPAVNQVSPTVAKPSSRSFQVIFGLVLVIVFIAVIVFVVLLKKSKVDNAQFAASFSQPDPTTRPFISCPLEKVQCTIGKEFEGAIRYSPLGNGILVLASAEGKKTASGEDFLLIVNEERRLELRYEWTGDFTQSSEDASSYTQGETIGIFGGEGSLTITAKNTTSNNPIRLGIGETADYLTNSN